MEVWYAIPTAQPDIASECVLRWKRQGYRTAVAVDHPGIGVEHADMVVPIKYRGYASAVNILSKFLCCNDDQRIIVTGGDDIWPDPDKDPQAIAADFYDRFPDGFGVMQPTGDRYGSIDSCCPSPWFGAGWVHRAYAGSGPLCDEYFHFFVDEELRLVAESLGVFYARPDVTQYHDHWERKRSYRPVHLETANEKWAQCRAIFDRRKAKGFPGHEPID